MKKIILLLALVTLLITTVQAQEVLPVYQVGECVWNKVSQKWTIGEGNRVEMKITMQGHTMMVSDKGKSVYTTVKVLKETVDDDNFHNTVWKGFDEKGRDCSIQLCFYAKSGRATLYVFYSELDWGIYYDINVDG